MSQTNPLLAYEDALKRRGYDTDAIERRVRLARAILMEIDPADTSNTGYRQAVERVIAGLPNPAAVACCQQVARDLFPHFVAAGRRIPFPTKPSAPPPAPITVVLPAHTGLDDLIQQALAMKATPEEKRALERYAEQLKSEGLDWDARERRLAIARLLLLGMRPLTRDGRHYRALIERLLLLFTRDETRSYFLGVAREFYPHLFAAGGQVHPDA